MIHLIVILEKLKELKEVTVDAKSNKEESSSMFDQGS